MDGDTHDLCVLCLGVEHALSVFEGADGKHCERLLLCTPCSHLSLFEERNQAHVPHGSGPTAAEAAQRQK